MLNIIWVKLKDFKESIPMMITMTALALVLIYVFGRSFNSADLPKVGIADEDGTQVSEAYVEQLIDLGGFNYEVTTFEEGLEDAREGNYIALVEIEEGFTDNLLTGEAGISLYKSGNALEHFTLETNIQSLGRLFILDEGFLSGVPEIFEGLGIETSKESLSDTLYEQIDKYPVLNVDVKAYDGGNTGGFDSLRHSFIGFILFFSMFTMVFGIGSIVDEKENRVWHRQLVSPMSAGTVLTGNMVTSFTVGMIQLGFMVVFSRLIFRIDWGGSMVAMLAVLGAFVLAVTCMGLFMSTLVKTMQQLGSFSPIVIVSTSMIGGCMWPLEIIDSKILLFLADLTPQRWAYSGLKAVIINSGGMADVTGDLVRLLVIAAVFLVLAMIPYMKSLKTAV